MYTEIIGTGFYLPEKRLTTKEIIERRELNINPEILDRLFPITERREANINESCSDMLVKTSHNVFKNAGRNGHEINIKDLDTLLRLEMFILGEADSRQENRIDVACKELPKVTNEAVQEISEMLIEADHFKAKKFLKALRNQQTTAV